MRFFILIISLICGANCYAQTLGGSSTFNFLRLPSAPTLAAAGGVNVSYRTNDVGLTANNPALLDSSFNSALQASFNSFYKGTKSYSLTGSLYSVKLNTSFAAHVFFFDYGSIPQTTSAGNIEGSFRPVDFVVQASAAKKYLEKWQYGISLKFIQSNYGQYRSSGVAADLGLFYTDSSSRFSAGFLAKNMGHQIRYYSTSEEIPFDVQLGITKKLEKAPLGFSLSAQQVHRFNNLYNDTAFNNANNQTQNASLGALLFNHFVLATHFYPSKELAFSLGYNRLRRNELNLGAGGNGLNGFSAGFNAQIKTFFFSFARSYYTRSFAFNQLAIGLYVNQLGSYKRL